VYLQTIDCISVNFEAPSICWAPGNPFQTPKKPPSTSSATLELVSTSKAVTIPRVAFVGRGGFGR
jgi:hypothetical protein